MNKKITGLVLIGLFICWPVFNAAWAKDEKAKIPQGIKTKTAICYKFVEESGKYKKVLDEKTISRYDDQGHQIEAAQYDADGRLAWKRLVKYDDKGHQIEETTYEIKEESGKVQEVLTRQTIWEYEFYKK